MLFLAEEPRKQPGLNFTFLRRRIAQGRYFDIAPTFININGMFLLLLIGTNISNKRINFLVKSQNELTCMWNFEAKVVLGYVVTMCVNLPQGSGVQWRT